MTADLIQQLKDKILEQEKLLRQLVEASGPISVVVGGDKERLLIASSGSFNLVHNPGYGGEGDLVRTHPQSGQIIGLVEHNLPIGKQATIEKVEGNLARIEENGTPRFVLVGKTKPKEGDLVALDPFNLVVSKILTRDVTSEATQITPTPWDAIGGHDTAKAYLRAAIEDPLTHSAIYKAYGKQAAKGVLLYGPPGCGKTLLAKAAATAAAQSKGKIAFKDIKGPELLTPYIGETERKIRELFLWAKAHKQKNGFAAIIFIDEAEALLTKRGGRISSDMEATIVPTFLTQMDGLESSSAFILLATNRPDVLDSAIIREGRIDRTILVDRPNEEESKSIFNVYFRNAPLSSDTSAEDLSCVCAEQTSLSPSLRERISGALINGIVEESKAIAMARDIEAKAKKASGITQDDALAAIERLQ